ncbi:MAG: UDP-N-acetylmuramoyl-L-alanyl-D-glutamate--2,6-diaminopimelate ligase [Candidatus Eisenbacteria bacterium]|uniref:UDP-N-acetylmuramoyl-L-alanyl-D-glutamate--2,6-diaminopimelate ligase n=1 Tax=Eiseniibacteriota bacterium TaxID=2212470 RepID=A0A538TWV2_UNCEI|nr:MAG: UDP-N-acetylmuramoyl-L-alanyl-D-glutamate--2,6-diaminopimelate ligase [Candidatus Eisenbacteria bacterium]
MLRALLDPIDARAVVGSLDVEVRGLAYELRRVRKGDAFFALAGARQDGAAFARQAVTSGAVAVVGQEVGIEGATVVQVEDPRRALARAAARFHDDPSRTLRVIAVTGTNGKTTTTYLLESIVRASGALPGIIGTTGVHLGDERRPAQLTTPEAPELQALLREMRDRGVVVAAIEMSSHALVQRRGFGLHCDAAVFTNLTHDHLDYHGTMAAYLDAKRMLFDGRNDPEPVKPCAAVINAADPAAGTFEESARRGGMRVLLYRGEPGEGREDLAVHVTALTPDARGLDLELRIQGSLAGDGRVATSTRRDVRLRLPLLGRYNGANAAAAFAAAGAIGIAPESIVRGLEQVAGVPGRLERIDQGQPFLVAVDYAHTPDALERALAAVRDHAPGRVLLVFGCGGDRDRAKRPVMGRVAAASADRVWITNDNPRGEDPAAIARDIEAGMGQVPRRVELDRRLAIAQALDAAGPGDVALIAGKGHETTQTIGDRALPFDDRAVAAEILRARAAGGSR